MIYRNLSTGEMLPKSWRKMDTVRGDKNKNIIVFITHTSRLFRILLFQLLTFMNLRLHVGIKQTRNPHLRGLQSKHLVRRYDISNNRPRRCVCNLCNTVTGMTNSYILWLKVNARGTYSRADDWDISLLCLCQHTVGRGKEESSCDSAYWHMTINIAFATIYTEIAFYLENHDDWNVVAACPWPFIRWVRAQLISW